MRKILLLTLFILVIGKVCKAQTDTTHKQVPPQPKYLYVVLNPDQWNFILYYLNKTQNINTRYSTLPANTNSSHNDTIQLISNIFTEQLSKQLQQDTTKSKK